MQKHKIGVEILERNSFASNYIYFSHWCYHIKAVDRAPAVIIELESGLGQKGP